MKMYEHVILRYKRISWKAFHNPTHSGCVAREFLRQNAVAQKFKRYVPTDDNARYTEESLENLIDASFAYPVQPCIVSGFHGTAPHFDASKIKNAKVGK